MISGALGKAKVQPKSDHHHVIIKPPPADSPVCSLHLANFPYTQLNDEAHDTANDRRW